MVNKEILNQEFLKSIESEYIFDNAPINRFIKNKESGVTNKKLADLKSKIKSIEDCELKKFAKNIVFSDGNPCSQIMLKEQGHAHTDMRVVHEMTAAVQLNHAREKELRSCGHVWFAQNDSIHAAT